MRQNPFEQVERVFLGSLLDNPAIITRITQVIDESVFSSELHKLIFCALKNILKTKTKITAENIDIELINYLDKQGHSIEVNEFRKITFLPSQLEQMAFLLGHGSFHSAILVINNLITTQRQDSASPSIIDISTSLESFSHPTRFRKRVRNARELLNNTWDEMEEYLKDRNKSFGRGIPTDFIELDEILCGLHNGDLFVIASRPSIGKTIFLHNIIRNAGLKSNKRIMLFSLESKASAVMEGLLSAQAKVEARKLESCNFSNDDMNQLGPASEKLTDMGLWVDDTPKISISELRKKAIHFKELHDIEIIAIDYLQLMSVTDAANMNREQEIAFITRELKELARLLDIPVLLISQLSRKPETRYDLRPILSDLRDSGAIEQDADVVLLLHRPECYDEEDSPGQIEVKIAKQRNGVSATVNLAFIPNQKRVENLANFE